MKQLLILILTAGILAACNINAPLPTPTVESLVTETATVAISPTETVTLTVTMTRTPSPAPTTALPDVPVMVDTIAPVPTEGPAPVTAMPTPTRTPWVYTIQSEDTLGYIIQLPPWSYRYSLDVMQAVANANDNMTSIDLLPPAGSQIVIPFRTATPIPEGLELTQTAAADIGVGEVFGQVSLPPGAGIGCHIVEEGETILSLRDDYDTTLEILSQLNDEINFFGCQFSTPGGGPNCNPIISIGQCVNVPQPTPVPSSTPTPSGNETATPTPTYEPARLVFPPSGALAPPGVFTLQWVSAGVLKNNEVYLVEVRDLTNNGDTWRQVTKSTSLSLPESLIPADGQTHDMEWRVVVARQDADSTVNYIGGQGDWRSFKWQSR